ncbi:transcriptional regulator [Vibrio cyclitrophicus ZF207]|nr:helix-turn-helix transcriptional regulator [Vibrio cyclitrophicus]OEE19167.1 transcriptional regulator [Vibrio cyclitrophicus ZF207]
MEKILVHSVAETIRSIRKQKQLNQEELADLSSLDRTYISGVERGTRNITLDSLESIILALSVTHEEFFIALSKQIANIK